MNPVVTLNANEAVRQAGAGFAKRAVPPRPTGGLSFSASHVADGPTEFCIAPFVAARKVEICARERRLVRVKAQVDCRMGPEHNLRRIFRPRGN